MSKQTLASSAGPLAARGLAPVLALSALAAGQAQAAEPIKLSVGGFFRAAYLAVSDDGGVGELGKDHAADGFFNDAEIHFTGATTLDNGLEVGARVELEGETDGDQVDEAWLWFAGGFGEIRIGSEDEALANACIVPPGGTTNFSAFSPNQWGANAAGLFNPPFGILLSSNSVCSGVDERGDAQKIVYISPVYGGFQLTASYTPSAPNETHADGVGPHVGMPGRDLASLIGQSRHNLSAYLTYSYEGADWGLTAGAGGSWEGHVEEGFDGISQFEKQDFYQAGINLTIGHFAIGIAGEIYNDVQTLQVNNLDVKTDYWVAGIGAAYALDAWTFGAQYSHRDDDLELGGGANLVLDREQDRIVGTVNYALGPGINIDGEVGYTWVDSNPDFATGIDDYDAIEFSVGSSISF